MSSTGASRRVSQRIADRTMSGVTASHSTETRTAGDNIPPSDNSDAVIQLNLESLPNEILHIIFDHVERQECQLDSYALLPALSRFLHPVQNIHRYKQLHVNAAQFEALLESIGEVEDSTEPNGTNGPLIRKIFVHEMDDAREQSYYWSEMCPHLPGLTSLTCKDMVASREIMWCLVWLLPSRILDLTLEDGHLLQHFLELRNLENLEVTLRLCGNSDEPYNTGQRGSSSDYDDGKRYLQLRQLSIIAPSPDPHMIPFLKYVRPSILSLTFGSGNLTSLLTAISPSNTTQLNLTLTASTPSLNTPATTLESAFLSALALFTNLTSLTLEGAEIPTGNNFFAELINTVPTLERLSILNLRFNSEYNMHRSLLQLSDLRRGLASLTSRHSLISITLDSFISNPTLWAKTPLDDKAIADRAAHNRRATVIRSIMESAEAKGIRCAGTAIEKVRLYDAGVIIMDLRRELELIHARAQKAVGGFEFGVPTDFAEVRMRQAEVKEAEQRLQEACKTAVLIMQRL